jgi:hypothetical protein
MCECGGIGYGDNSSINATLPICVQRAQPEISTQINEGKRTINRRTEKARRLKERKEEKIGEKDAVVDTSSGLKLVEESKKISIIEGEGEARRTQGRPVECR